MQVDGLTSDIHTGLSPHSMAIDLQIYQFGGGTEKTLWQLCQLIDLEIPVN